ncbi:MAG: hypothetical protein KDA24_10130 [Deltaproteobacteria bacterium]|nr:hypothetical protein [Deltaproteobacteria bacterium]
MSGELLRPWLHGEATGPIHVIGASGAEGVALLQYLVGELGIPRVHAHDFSADERAFAKSFRRANTSWERPERERILKALRSLPVTWHLGESYCTGLDGAGLIFASQNWFNYSSNMPALPNAIAAGVPLRGVVDLAMDLFPGTRLGVTGSNGKSTTSGLLAHLLREGLPTERALQHGGNDRNAQARLDALATSAPEDCLVWEVSNRHLRDRTVPVDIAVLTNVTANHIEDHGSWEAYVAAKARLVRGATQVAVLSATDPESVQLIESVESEGVRVWLAGCPPGDPLDRPGRGLVWVSDGTLVARAPGASSSVPVGDPTSLPLPGAHNQRNLMSAVAAALEAGLSPARLATAWSRFAPMPGRLEEVAERDGVRWIYDIQATTAPASEAGIRAVGESSRLVLLVGGEDKGMDYAGMANAAADHARAIIALPGTGAVALCEALAGRVPVTDVPDLDAALIAARNQAEAGDAVLLSPGAAFFQSRFITPGRSFARRVRDLLG